MHKILTRILLQRTWTIVFLLYYLLFNFLSSLVKSWANWWGKTMRQDVLPVSRHVIPVCLHTCMWSLSYQFKNNRCGLHSYSNTHTCRAWENNGSWKNCLHAFSRRLVVLVCLYSPCLSYQRAYVSLNSKRAFWLFPQDDVTHQTF